jgi:hypothetical protein
VWHGRRVVEEDREVGGAASDSLAQFDALGGVEGAGEEEVGGPTQTFAEPEGSKVLMATSVCDTVLDNGFL